VKIVVNQYSVHHRLEQRCTHRSREAVRFTLATEFYAVLPHICGLLEWNLHYFTLPVPRILRGLLEFWKVCVLLVSVHDQTTHRQVHRAHIQIEGIRPQIPKKTNDEAGS
jgi:hypothetical protein